MACKKDKLIYGWGVVDVDYNVTRSEIIKGEWKTVWVCPYYRKWKDILQRCFCPKFQEKNPTYKDCTVTDGWKHLSDFIKWVDSQPNRDWESCDADKDFLSAGNKHYSSETVVFISGKVNGFITDCGKTRGDYMIGVNYVPNQSKKNPYQVSCRNPFGGSRHVGYYPTEIEANKAWQARKHELALQLAEL